MAEKRYCELRKITDYEGECWMPYHDDFVESETLTLSDIIKAEIKDGSLKGLREKIDVELQVMTRYTDYFELEHSRRKINIEEKEKLKQSQINDTLNAILTLLAEGNTEEKAKGGKG